MSKPAPAPAVPVQETSTASKPWRWVLLALWFLWLAFLIFLSRNEWGKPRPQATPAQEQADKVMHAVPQIRSRVSHG